ncbi:MAG: ABC transporter permease [Phycisphaerae bacterium]|nr:ABC transporter permease [Phycisphaerae bacterium]NUQ47179.1 ABC transporter permease [Phycisphaerae bacterium]
MSLRFPARVATRLLQSLIVLFTVYTVTFVMIVAVPGNPFQREGARALAPDVERGLRERYGMQSNVRFYVDYLRRVMHGDLGVSLEYRNWTCNQIIADALPVSMAIGAVAIAVAALAGVTLGAASAVRPGGWIDLAAMGLAALAVSIPTFVVAAVLLVLFSVTWPMLPAGQWSGPLDLIRPAVALSLVPMAYVTRLTRSGMIEAMSADYVRTARAKGLSERHVVWRHALPNALLPVVNYLGPAAAWTMTGSFVVERVFNIPGLGTHFVNGVLNRDQMLVLAVVLVFSTIILLFNLLVDLACAWLDPRVGDAAQ